MFGSCGRLLFLIHDRCQLDPAHDLSLPVNVWLPTDTSAMFPPATNVLNSLQSILDLLQRMDRITAQIARITYQMENESSCSTLPLVKLSSKSPHSKSEETAAEQDHRED